MGEVTAAVLLDGNVIEHVALDSDLAVESDLPTYGDSEFIWIEVFDPVDADFALLRERFRLHDLAVEDSMSSAQVPKVDVYDDQIFVVLKVARLEDDAIKYSEIDAFVSANHIITVRRAADCARAHVHERVLKGPTQSEVRPDYILHRILDFVVNDYFPVVQMIEDEVLSMEKHLQDAFLGRDEINRLLRLRREAIQFQHVLTRMSDVCGKLIHLDVPCIDATTKPYFRDVHAHLIRLDAMVIGLVDVILTVFETSSLLEQQRQGVITRQLVAWAAILGVPAAVAGVYGLAFPNAPEMHVLYGYSIVAGMLSICLGLYLRFKKLRWL